MNERSDTTTARGSRRQDRPAASTLGACLRTLGVAAAATGAIGLATALVVTLLRMTSATLGYTFVVGALYVTLASSVVAWLLLMTALFRRKVKPLD